MMSGRQSTNKRNRESDDATLPAGAPATPDQIAAFNKMTSIPPRLFDVVNDQISKNYDGQSASVYYSLVEAIMNDHKFGTKKCNVKLYMDQIEKKYEEFGWAVKRRYTSKFDHGQYAVFTKKQ